MPKIYGKNKLNRALFLICVYLIIHLE